MKMNLINTEQLKTMLDYTDATIWYRDIVNDACWVSRANTKIYGYTLEDFNENPYLWKDVIFPEDKEIIDEHIRLQLEGQPSKVEYRIIHSSGSIRWIEDRATPITDQTGKLTATTGIIIDITENKMESIKLAESEERYRNLIELAPLSVLVHQEGRIVYANPEAIRSIGANHENKLLGKPIQNFFIDNIEKWRERLDQASKGEEIPYVEYKVKTLDERIIQIESNGSMISFNRKPAYMVIGKDITEKKELERQLQLSEQRYKSLFTHNMNAVYSLDLKGYFSSMNTAGEKICGYSSSELLKMSFTEMIVEDDLPKAISAFKCARDGHSQNYNLRIKNKSEELVYLNVTNVPIMVEDQIIGVYGIARDVTERIKSREMIQQLAFHDHLTGLPNRNRLAQHLSKELLSSKANKLGTAVLFIDLDRFKVINDTLGHSTGDVLLKEVSERLKGSVLDDKGIVFRQGGDEFIVVLSDADRTAAANVAKRLIKTLSVPITINNYDLYTSPSIGISLYPDDGDSVETLIKHADFAMYQSKKAGKNTYTFYSFDELISNGNHLKIEMDLRNALSNNEFFLHYQPKVCLRTGKIVGVEALIRWNHSQMGLISPGCFIPIAEETGLIIPIGEWALYTACQQTKKWHQKGFKTKVSVNLSVRQFTHSDLVTTVEHVLQKTGLEPQYLELEITESMTADIDRTISVLLALKKLGVQISIDDFGTGYSSLYYLKDFPIDTLKIDQCFVKELFNNQSNETIVKTIISMAHNLNLRVVAEGIETKEQLLFLQQHLCDGGQGYFFSKPLSADEIEEELKSIQQAIKEFGVSEQLNEQLWAEELLRLARKELNDTIRLQEGMTFKIKKINGQFIHTLCDGELLYRLGLVPNQVVGKSLHEFLPEKMAKEKEQYFQRAWNGEERVIYEEVLNGIYYMAVLSPIKRGGEVVEVIASCIDITDRKKAEEALLESETKYRLITENMTDLVGVLDVNGVVLYASPSHEFLCGFTPEVYEGNLSFNWVHPDDIPLMKKQLSNVISTKTPFQVEYRSKHANGGWLDLEVLVTPVVDSQGEIQHIIAVGRDISERKKAEELIQKSEKLSVVGELAAGVAHEIRNPITSIKGFIQLFQKGFIKDEYYEIILTEFNRIEEIINEFLNLAKPQKIKPKLVSIPDIVKEVETLITSEFSLRNIQFFKKIEPDLPIITCDSNQIKQVLINLCKNSMDAIEINNKGLINIKVGTEKENMLIQITDNGIGISEERLQRLGEPFFSNKERGTGLGLMLCFRIIREHKGTITFKSKENIGTTVEVRLPISFNGG